MTTPGNRQRIQTAPRKCRILHFLGAKWTKPQPAKQKSKYAAALRRGAATPTNIRTTAEVNNAQKSNDEEAMR